MHTHSHTAELKIDREKMEDDICKEGDRDPHRDGYIQREIKQKTPQRIGYKGIKHCKPCPTINSTNAHATLWTGRHRQIRHANKFL